MVDCTFAWENIAVGGAILAEKNYEELAKHYGITHIIDAQAEWDDTPIARYYGIETCWVPAWDDLTKPRTSSFLKAVKFVENSIMKDSKAKVLCHCAGGVHRGPMFGLLTAMRMGIKESEAVAVIKEVRPIAFFPETYRSAVSEFMAKYMSGKMRG